MTRVPPWTIVAGLGTLGREELCDLLAIFRDVGLYNLAVDRVADITKLVSERDAAQGDDTAFRRRLAETSAHLRSSHDSDGVLRLRLWAVLRDAFDVPPILPLSIRAAGPASADLAHAAAVVLTDALPSKKAEGDDWTATALAIVAKAASLLGSEEHASFDEVVAFQAVRLTAQAAESGLLDKAAKAELVGRIRERLSGLPPELRDETVDEALKMGDTATLGLLVSGSSLVGLGVAVDLAGFAAYQLAAQASAFLPLIGGKAAVSGLFVLANPLFIVPTLIGGGFLVGRNLSDSVRKKLAGSLVVLFALRGLAGGHEGLKACLDGFRSLDRSRFEIGDLGAYVEALWDARSRVGHDLPSCPPSPPPGLAELSGSGAEILVDILFPDASGGADKGEARALAGLTTGDILYSAASIDPKTIMAADFSRSEDLADIFRFGSFSERLDGYTEASLAGAENHLRGYVAERVVAARLQEQGHQIEWPETANNPGVDLLVDGEPFQVKCLSGIDGLAHHFEKYPDIPVFANGDIVDAASSSGADWADMVLPVEGFDYGIADQIMHRSLEAGADLMNVHMHVPIFAAAVSSARNIHGWWKGSVPLANLPFEIALGGAAKGGLAAAGGLAGKGIGLLLFGPAGAVVGGGLGGVVSTLGAGRLRSAVDGLVAPEWEKDATTTCDAFLDALEVALAKKADILTGKLRTLEADHRAQTRWIADRIADDRLFVLEGAGRVSALRRKPGDIQSRTQVALRIMHDHAVHPWTVREQLSALLAVVNSKPTVASTAAELSKDAVQKANELIGGLMKGWLPRL